MKIAHAGAIAFLQNQHLSAENRWQKQVEATAVALRSEGIRYDPFSNPDVPVIEWIN